MSRPILYSPVETDFTHNGIGILSDCISCEVTEELNGMFELSMKYPSTGIHFNEIANRSLIKAVANQSNSFQIFRVYSISKPMNGIVTVSAEHISYDLSGIPVSPFSVSSVVDAMAGFKNNAATDCPFEFWTDKQTVNNFSVSHPRSIRSCFAGFVGSLLDVYGGEFEFDNYTVKLYNKRGKNRGVSIRYGKNLTNIKQNENCANVYTGVYPYWISTEDATMVELDEKIVSASGSYNFTRVKPVDLSGSFGSAPTQEQLRAEAEAYMEQNEIGIPAVSLSVSFAQLEQYDEYKDISFLERVFLGDTVNVEFPELCVSTTAKVTKIVYDSIMERVKSANLGSVRASFVDTVVKQQQDIEKIESPTFIKQAAENATKWISNGKGYVSVIKDANGQASEILIMDTPDIETAVKVWRWNNGGLGYSETGYYGEYVSAITQDGTIVADFIKAGNMTASVITLGVLQSNNGQFRVNLETGEISIGGYATSNEIGNVQNTVGRAFADIANVKSDIEKVSENTNSLTISVNGILENGVTKVATSTGYTFDQDGLKIRKAGQQMENKLDDTGMVVSRSGTPILQATAAGVEATDVKVNNYLIVGNCRFEDYTNGTDSRRTACFFTGEGG